jgi:twitching motility protein PilT
VFDFEALLRLLHRRDGSELRIAPGRSPQLISGDDVVTLALPETESVWLRELAFELMGADRRAAFLAGQEVQFAYRIAELGSFDVLVQGSPGQPSLVVRPEVDRTMMTLDPDAGVAAPEEGLDVPDALRVTLEIAHAAGASDVHLGDGAPPVMRVGGLLAPMPAAPVAGARIRPLVEAMLTAVGRRRLADGLAVDFSFSVDGVGRCRGNAYRALKGFNLAVRVLPATVPTLRDLRLPGSLSSLADYQNGLVLFVGPTGSGKTASMAALVNHINQTRAVHVITLEDPVEFVHARGRALIRQREVGVHVASFAEGLRDALREDPDVILVGEMRDLETMQLALTAAETGHLVISTLHASRAPTTVDRIVDVFPEHRQAQVRLQIAESLRGIVAQRLLPGKDGGGRVAALEVLRNNKAVANHIRESRAHQLASVMQTSREAGMWVLERHLAALFKRGIVSEEVARLHAEDQELFDSYQRSL